MVAETKKTDILASLGLVKAPASLTCLGKVRVGEEGPRCQAGYHFPHIFLYHQSFFYVPIYTSWVFHLNLIVLSVILYCLQMKKSILYN